MSIETTLNINREILEKLEDESGRIGKSRSWLIKLLMQKMMDIEQKKVQSFKQIEYQERDLKENWHRMHITLKEYEYEFFLDLRKVYKMSVSHILAVAVMKFLSCLETPSTGNRPIPITVPKSNTALYTDNYRYESYVFSKEIIEGVVTWHFYWGIPQKHLAEMHS